MAKRYPPGRTRVDRNIYIWVPKDKPREARYLVIYKAAGAAQYGPHPFDTLAEARAWRDHELPKAKARLTGSAIPHATVADFYSQWEADLSTSGETRRKYLRFWKQRIEPEWGTRLCSSITTPQVVMWRDRLLDDLTEGSAKDVVGILGNLLEYAREAGAIDSNPARGLRWRGRGSRAKQQNILTPSQIAAFTEELQRSRYDDKVGYSSLVLFLVGTGCRYGEATALAVGDVDLATGTATIRRTVTRSETGKVTIGSTTKTGETRTVSMPPQVVEALRPRVADRHPTELVWHALRGDVYTPLPMPATSHSWWSEAVARCVADDDTFPKGLGRHDLRHTAASLLISAGANVLQVQRQLGHAKPSITLDTYSHLFDSGLGEVGAKMGEILDSGCSEVVVESHPEK